MCTADASIFGDGVGMILGSPSAIEVTALLRALVTVVQSLGRA